MIDDFALPCPAMQTDGSGRILAMNREMLRTAGLEAAPAAGTVMDTLMPPASKIFLQTHLWPMLLRDGQLREVYLHLRSAAHGRVPVLTNAGPGTYNGIACFTWVMFVAHERSQFESELIKARNHAQANASTLAGREHFMRALANATGRALGFLDLGARCRFANERFGHLMMRTVDDLDGASWHEWVPSAHRVQHRAALEAALRGGAPAALPWDEGDCTPHFQYTTRRNEHGTIEGCFMVERGEP
jgi:PAS domain-containing protein